jgi:hypothetical protein
MQGSSPHPNVLVETVALLQRRIGLAAVQDFQTKIVPLLEFIGVDSTGTPAPCTGF